MYKKRKLFNNAKVILSELNQRKINTKKLETLFDSLPKEEWDLTVIQKNISAINDVFGVSNEEIKKHSVENLSEKDLEMTKWRLVVESFNEYSVFAKNNYDAMKYDTTAGLSVEKLKLFNEIMQTFKVMHSLGNTAYSHYKSTTQVPKNKKKVIGVKLILDSLMLRLLYISYHLSTKDDKKTEYYAELLSKERISVSYHSAA